MFSEFNEMKELSNDKRSERPHILGDEITQLQHMTGEKLIRIVKIPWMKKNGNSTFRHCGMHQRQCWQEVCVIEDTINSHVQDVCAHGSTQQLWRFFRELD